LVRVEVCDSSEGPAEEGVMGRDQSGCGKLGRSRSSPPGSDAE
jgi:hypothetical protein